uniref:CIMAP1 family member D n=1 Tax=Hucho hucho TaxID=62062 RepID=A0A4W5RQ29_9TELE
MRTHRSSTYCPTSPAYSFHGRMSNNCDKFPPTSGKYTFNSEQPAFSMLGRHGFPNNATLKPGPGTHNPEKVTVHKPRAPAFSMGIRHSEFVTPLVVNVAD